MSLTNTNFYHRAIRTYMSHLSICWHLGGRKENRGRAGGKRSRTAEGISWRLTGELAQKGLPSKEKTFSMPFPICMTQTNSFTLLNSTWPV